MRVKMSQAVRWSDGVVRTPRQALDAGIAEITVSERFSTSGRSAPRRAVFVEEIGTGMVVEVSGYVAPAPERPDANERQWQTDDVAPSYDDSDA